MAELTISTEKERFLTGAELLRRDGPEWLQSLRRSAEERFLDLEFPHRKMEQWRFTNIGPLLKTAFTPVKERTGSVSREDFAPWSHAGQGWVELVFVDGEFAPELSEFGTLPEGLRVCSMREALNGGDGAAVQEHLDAYYADGNVFNALNTVMFRDGAFVEISRKAVVEQPVHCLYLATPNRGPVAAHPRNLVIAGTGSQAAFVETYAALDGASGYFNNGVSEIGLGAGARLSRYRVMAEARDAYHLSSVRVRQERDSQFRSFSFFLDAKIGRNDLSVVLDGEGAECSLDGLYLAAGASLIDNATSIEHVKPHCSSWIGYKGVLDGRSKAVFTGRIMVHREAQKTDSKQLNNNLLLSDDATIDTKPMLEIFADDVKCTHGATVGRPPEEQIFYFRSRGISEATAHAMLTCGFANDIVEKVELEPLRRRLEKIVLNRYNPQRFA